MHRLLDGEPGQGNPEMHRLLLLSRVCEEFGCLPQAAARELECDPDHLALQILDLRGYIRAKRTFDGARDKTALGEGWDENPYSPLVERHTLELHRARVSADRTARSATTKKGSRPRDGRER